MQYYVNPQLAQVIKRIVLSKMKTVIPLVFPNMYYFIYALEHKWRYFSKMLTYFFFFYILFNEIQWGQMLFGSSVLENIIFCVLWSKKRRNAYNCETTRGWVNYNNFNFWVNKSFNYKKWHFIRACFLVY